MTVQIVNVIPAVKTMAMTIAAITVLVVSWDGDGGAAGALLGMLRSLFKVLYCSPGSG